MDKQNLNAFANANAIIQVIGFSGDLPSQLKLPPAVTDPSTISCGDDVVEWLVSGVSYKIQHFK